MEPLVSICIPTFNAETYIKETIASALGQTYSPLEIIVSDDNSTDRTVEIVMAILEGQRIPYQIFSHEQYGLGKNWNFCVEKAQGKYIKFLFQDDILYPNCVADLVQIAQLDTAIGMVFSRREILYSDQTTLDPLYINITDRWTTLETVQTGAKLLTDPNLLVPPFNKIGEPTNTLILKAAFDRLGGFDNHLQQVIDWDMWLRIMGHYKIGFADQVLSRFRIHRSQLSQQNRATPTALLDTWKLFFKILSDREYAFLASDLKMQIAQYCSDQITTTIGELYTLRDQNVMLDRQIQQLGDQNETLGEQVKYYGKQAEVAYAQMETAKEAFTKLETTEARLTTVGKELENLHREYLQIAQTLQTTSDHLLETNANLVQTQQQLAESNSTVAAQQGSITYLENALANTQEQLQQTTKELQQTIEAKITVEQERDTQIALLKQTKQEMEALSLALVHAQDRIVAMESSKFWKLRTKWLQIKKFLGLSVEEA